VANDLRGVDGGLFIAPTLKEPLGESSTGQVQWDALEAGEVSGNRSHVELIWSTGLVQYHYRTSLVGLSRSRYKSLEADHEPDKSGGGTKQVRYPPLKAGNFTEQVR
jgi:hypothetical protein